MKNVILATIILLTLTPSAVSAVGIEKIGVVYDTVGLPSDYINVSIQAIGMYQIKEIQLELTYNPNVITIENTSTGGLISGGTTIEMQKDTGKIAFKVNNSDGLYGSDSLVRILFKSIGSAGKSSPLNVNLIKVMTTENYDLNTSTIKIDNSEYIIGEVVTMKVETIETPISTLVEITPVMTETTTESTETTAEPIETTAEPTSISTPVKQTPGFVVITAISTIIIVLVVRRVL